MDKNPAEYCKAFFVTSPKNPVGRGNFSYFQGILQNTGDKVNRIFDIFFRSSLSSAGILS
jgi:hypothetical protein